MLSEELKKELYRLEMGLNEDLSQLEMETFEIEDLDVNGSQDVNLSSCSICTCSCSATSCSVCV